MTSWATYLWFKLVLGAKNQKFDLDPFFWSKCNNFSQKVVKFKFSAFFLAQARDFYSIKNQYCFSESDLYNLLNVHKIPSRNLIIFTNSKNNDVTTSTTYPKDNSQTPSSNSSILDPVRSKNCSSQSHIPLAQIMCVAFLDIFYNAVHKHFSCPICNEPLHKPQMLPACGHTFCETCLTFWFSGNIPHSCPICRRFSGSTSRDLPQVFVYSVQSFIKTVGRLEKFFNVVKFIPVGHRSGALLLCLQLPSGKNNSKLLDSLSFSYPRLSSKSLSSIQKKWSFEQLLHNLRFAQLQAANNYFSNLPPYPTVVQRFQNCLLDIILMVCPFFPTFSRIYRVVRTLFTGRRRLRFVLPTVDNLCVFLVGLALAAFIFSLFSFLLQRGFRGHMRFISHVIIVFLVNDYINPV